MVFNSTTRTTNNNLFSTLRPFAKTLILLLLGMAFFVGGVKGQTAVLGPFSTNGDGTTTIPSGVTKATIECWGAGGTGGNSITTYKYTTSGGGGGGSYVSYTTSVTSGSYNYHVGITSTTTTPDANTNASYFGNTSPGSNSGAIVLANGGGAGPDPTSGRTSSPYVQAGVGSGGSLTGNVPSSGTTGSTMYAGTTGGSGTTSTGASGPGGAGAGPTGSTAGGSGGAANAGGTAVGTAGSGPGGGGSGSSRATSTNSSLWVGGSGADGQVKVTYYKVPTISTVNTVNPIAGSVSVSVTVSSASDVSQGITFMTVDGGSNVAATVSGTTVTATVTLTGGSHVIRLVNTGAIGTSTSTNSTNNITAISITDYYWGGATNNTTGNWDNSATKWNNAASGSGTLAWPSSGSYNANINTTGANLTLNQNPIAIAPVNTLLGANATFSTAGSQAGSLTSPIALGANTLTLAPVSAASLTLSTGVISGSGGIIQSGTGTSTLSGANTYTGTTVISAGTLTNGAAVAASTNGPFGNASTAIALGDANSTGSSNPTLLTGGASFDIGRSINITSNTAGTYTVGGGTANTSAITGGISLSNPLTISQVGSGTLNITTNAISSATTGTKALTFNNAGTVAVSAAITKPSGDISITQSGAGTTTLSSASNTFTGATTVSAGTLAVTGSGVIPSTSFALNGGVFQIPGSSALTYSPASFQSGLITMNGGTLQANTSVNFSNTGVKYYGINLTGTGTFDANGATITLQPTISGASGVLTAYNSSTSAAGIVLVNQGSNNGTANSSAHTYGGGTVITGNATKSVTLQIGGANALPTSTAVTFTASTLAILDLNAFSQTVSSLSGGASGGNIINNGGSDATLTVSNTSGSTTYDGTITDGSSKKVLLIKAGASTQILTGTNTYTGATTLSGGTLTLAPKANTTGYGSLTFGGGNLATTGITASKAITFSSLIISNSGNLTLEATNAHILTFTAAGTFTASQVITIYNWSGTAGATGSVGKVFIGSSASLNATQLAAISFNGFSYGAMQLSTGEIVPAPPTYYWGATNTGTYPASGASSFIASNNWGTGTSGSPNVTWTNLSGSNIANFSAATANNVIIPSSISPVPYLVNINAPTTFSTSGSVGVLTAPIVIASGQTLTTSPDASYPLTLSTGVISGAGALTNTTGTTTLSGVNTYSGTTTLTSGQLNINNAAAIGTGTFAINGGTIDNTSGADITLSTNNVQTWGGDFTYAGSANSLNLGTGGVTLGANRIVTVTNNNLTVAGIIAAGSYTLTKAGAGNLILTNTGALWGSTSASAGNTVNAVTVTGGYIDIPSEGVLGGPPTNLQGNWVYLNGGGLKYSATSGSTNMNSNRGITLGASGGTFNIVNSAATFTYSNALIGTNGSLIKTGAGTLTLAGTNTYTGTTSINAGTLNVTGSLGATAVTIGSAGTLTSTAGSSTTISGGITVNGTISPGGSGSTASTITTAANQSWNSGGTYICDLTGTGTTACDKIAITGSLTTPTSGSFTISIPTTQTAFAAFSGYAVNTNYSWTIASYTSLVNTNSNIVVYAPNITTGYFTVTLSGTTATLNYTALPSSVNATAAATNVTYTPSISGTITVQALGSGGGGGASDGTSANNFPSASGGGGGAYTTATYNVTGGTTYYYTVGAGGTGGAAGQNNGNDGNPSYFGTSNTLGSAVIKADGGYKGSYNGTGGSGGKIANCIPSTTNIAWAGGAGGNSSYSTSVYVSGGAGGGAAGTSSNGSVGTNAISGNGTSVGSAAGGAAGTGSIGSAGAASGSSSTAPSPASNGGGGGGAADVNQAGSKGGDGKIIITFTAYTPNITSLSPQSCGVGGSDFTLTVNGTNFVSGLSTVYFNGVARATTYNPGGGTPYLTAYINAADIASTGTYAVTVKNGTVSSTGTTNFVVATPSIVAPSNNSLLSGSLSTNYGTASVAQSFTLQASNLIANLNLGAVTGFEYSIDGTNYFSSLSIVPALVTISSNTSMGVNTTCYIRLSSSASIGSYNSNAFTFASTGATSVTVSTTATGNVVNSASSPNISSAKTFTTFTTTYGTVSAAQSFTVSGTSITDVNGIKITPPVGFEVSTASDFSSNVGTNASPIYISGTGTIASTTVYIRIQKTAPVSGTYNNNIIALTSTGATEVDLTTTTTGNAVSPYSITITASNVNKPYNTTLTSGSVTTGYSITTGSLQNSDAISGLTIAYGNGAAANAAVQTYNGTAVPSAAVFSTGVSSNYGITYVGGNITVTALTPPTLTVNSASVDNTFTITFTDDALWRGNISSITVGGTTLPTAAYDKTVSGQITFDPSQSSLLQSVGTKAIVITSTGYTIASYNQSLTVGAAKLIAFTTQPTAPATNGAVLATQPVVKITDKYGNATTSTLSITASVGAGTWTIGGTTSVNASGGTATFTDLTASSAASVTGATISFSGTGLTTGTSNTFNIPAPPPANDDCSGAVTLVPNAASATSGTNVNATNSGASGVSYSDYSSALDVWYSFTPTCTANHTITVTPTSGQDIVFAIFAGGSCPNPTYGNYKDANGSGSSETATYASLTAGVTYRIAVWGYQGTSGAFTISVSSATTPTLTTSSTGLPAAGNISSGASNVALSAFTVTPNCAATAYTLNTVKFTTSGTATTSDLSNFRVYYDANANGVYDNGTDVLASASPLSLAASMTFTLSGQTGLTAARTYFLVADVSLTATAANTFVGSIATAADVNASLTPTGTTTSGTVTGNTQTILGNYFWYGSNNTWGASNVWNIGSQSGSLGTWADNNIATLGGTASTITLGTSPTANSIAVNTTGYTLTTTGAARTITGSITLANNVNLNLAPTASYPLTIGSVNGGTGSGLTIAGTNTSSVDVRVIPASGATIASTAPITISTGGFNTACAGFYVPSGTATIASTINNITSSPLVATLLGASSSCTLNVNGVVSSTNASGVQFAISSNAGGGAGTINLNAANTYTGPTMFNGASSGTVKLGVNNALPTGSDIIMGYSSGNGQILDLNGKTQTIQSLASNSGGTGSITSSASSAVLTIAQASNTSFGLPFTGTTKLSVAKSGAGILTLSGVGASHTFTGGLTVTGGEWRWNPVTSSVSTAVPVSLGGGTMSTTGCTASLNVTLGTLALTSSSTIALGTNSQFIKFSSLGTWTGGTILTVTGGTYKYDGTTGTGGQLFVGSSSSAASAQIANIRFFDGTKYYPAIQLSSGEIVPTVNLTVTNLGTQTAGTSFSISVNAIDYSGNALTVPNNIAFAITTNNTNTGTTSGTITAGNNTVSVSGIVLTTAATSTATITATPTSGYAGTSAAFTVNPGAPYKLVEKTAPSNVTASNPGTIPGSPAVYVQDQYNNICTGNNSVSVTASVGAGTWTISGTTTVSASSGVVTFTALTATSAANVTGATITYTTTGLTTNTVTSSAFNIKGACTAPTAQATSLVLTVASSTSVTGSFTVASGADGYLVVRTTTATAPPSPVNGTTTYAAGGTLGSSSYIESFGSGNTFTSSSLTTSTQYFYWVFAYNYTSCFSGPVFNTVNPLSGTTITYPFGSLATWTPTTSYTPSVNGVSATTLNNTKSSTFGSASTPGSGPDPIIGIYGTGYSSSGSRNTSDYIQFSLTPASGSSFTTSSLSISSMLYYNGASSASALYSVYYSTSSSFTSPVAISTGNSINDNYSIYTITPSLSLTISSGTTLYFRVYCYSDNYSNNYFGITSFVVNGSVPVTPPSISSQPTLTQTVCQSSTPTDLTVTASAGSGTISSYKWYSNTSNTSNGGTLVATHTSSLTTDSYTPPTTSAGTTYYYCIVTNSNNNTIASSVANVTVTPTNTITLASAVGTDAQTPAVNTDITNITYNTTGATGATFSGLPNGVTGSWSANVATISGRPTASSNNSYTVALTGGCGTVSANGTINVTALLTTAASTGGTVTVPSTSTTQVAYNASTTITAVANTGYSFSGWTVTSTPSSNASITSASSASTTVTLTAAATIQANFTINSYAVTFNSNGGSAVATQNINYNSTATQPSDPTKTGYTFAGWYTDAGLTSAYSFSTAVTSAITLYAKWTANSYTVTFNGNGNTSGTMGTQNFTYGTPANLTSNAFAKVGYTFAGWSTTSTGSVAYTDAASYSIGTANTTLYAQWTGTITYSVNGGSGTAPIDATNYLSGAYITTAASTGLSKTGYTFAGWNTAADGSGTTYAANTSSAFTFSGTITLYAKWTINSYAVTFNSNGGSAVATQNINYNSTATQPTDPTQTGYTFAGWYSDAGLTSAYSFSTSVTSAITLYAKWTANSYTVTFNGNGNTSGTMGTQNFTYGTPANLTSNAFAKVGYTFAGWSTTSTGSVAYTDAASYSIGTANTTLYAQWTCATGTWVGGASGTPNAWATAANWCGASVPVGSTDVVIPATSNNPSIIGYSPVNNLTVASGATLTVTGTLQVAGSITNSGTLDLTGGTLELNGTSDQTISGANFSNNTINGLTINNTSTTGAKGVTITGSNLNVTGTLTPTYGILTTNGLLTLKSTLTATARIATGATNGGYISGEVTVERYIRAKTARKYTQLGSAVGGVTIANSWQQQIYITGAGTGGTLCGTANSNGFDATATNQPSMFTYAANKTNNTRWKSVASTNNTNLVPGIGYDINIRGDRNSATVSCADQLGSTTPTAPEAVTLSATGTVSQGNVSVPLNQTTGANNSFTLIANPYPCPIDFTTFQSDNNNSSTGITQNMWLYSTNTSASGSHTPGNYTTYSGGVVTNAPTGYNAGNLKLLESGQAFFVQSASASATTVTFKETHKTTSTPLNNAYFGSNVLKLIRVGLQTTANASLDEVVIRFNNNGSSTYNPAYDAVSFNSGNQVLAVLKGTNRLAISTLLDSTAADSAKLGVKSASTGTFQLAFSDFAGIDSSKSITLVDKYLDSMMDVRMNQVYVFNITSDTASYGNNRFEVLFGAAASPLPVSFTGITANRKGANVEVKWTVANQVNIASYSVERSTDGTTFTNIATAKATGACSYSVEDARLPATASTLYYRVKSIGVDGSYRYSAIAKLNTNHLPPTTIAIYPNPVQDKLNILLGTAMGGNYSVRVLSVTGNEAMSKTGVSANGNNISLDATKLTAGVYMLELTDETGNKHLEKFVKK